MTKDIRVRFAPSPTGPLHIGGVRTALFNYLFAKKHQGTFILRIEDTDQNRFVEGAEQYIDEALSWCGIHPDESAKQLGDFGPYRQSERKDLYKEYADQLIENGKAYYAFDTPEALDQHRKDHEAKGKTFIYNWHNREKLNNSLKLSKEEVQQKMEANEAYVIRFKVPKDKILQLDDIVRGDIEIDSNTLDDKVLFKSDGMPTYHLANVVDDHLMKISHVIRGEEWLPSLALHHLLYQAFERESPKFAHLPLILKPVGKGKLSKRDGDKMGFPVFPLEWKDPKTGEVSNGYKEEGYLPEAVVNMLALLGWHPESDQEILSTEELIQLFSLEQVTKAGAKFDPDKTKWFQQQYLHEADHSYLLEEFKKILDEKNIKTNLDINKIVDLVRERAIFAKDLWDLSIYFFKSPDTYDEKAIKKSWKSDTGELLEQLLPVIDEIQDFSANTVNKRVKEWIASQEISFGKVMMPLRIALVGSLQGVDVFEIMSVISKEESINRIQTAISKNASTHDQTV
ncbi:glutamate--tRNA ligase [Aquimarina sp. ERC-38]|uniref:glutamate--tRNA ligase n=1 Tax=Aquimarina sp. ERC-38 TaxID=2949996 RepID=UPI002245E811|nr:glutamate--tRNA ligase [Aquimarina sp. ERC-38]UZO81838.1 glutamate--tRNA ligase [Aquimarina sp. ERC-38]